MYNCARWAGAAGEDGATHGASLMHGSSLILGASLIRLFPSLMRGSLLTRRAPGQACVDADDAERDARAAFI